ncbi:unnamed protein product [Echinostoma caproni]|uniref:C2H2-type domain-containing protein n=1 Tax=Echinostoma caproni TaxID=27848 RepID=A0A183B4X6_9TREM|nr:unnamed protein product [Echinostoma caproni]
MENQMMFDNLDEKFEDETSVVRSRNSHATFAKRKDNGQVDIRQFRCAYSGIRTGQLVVRLVPQEKMKQAAEAFSSSPTKVVYSLHRKAHISSSALASIDVWSNLPVDKLKRLTTIPWEPRAGSRVPLAVTENNTANRVPQVPAVMTGSSVSVSKPTAVEKNPHVKTVDVKNFFAPISKNKTKIDTVTAPPPKPVHKRPSTFNDSKKENKPVSKSPVVVEANITDDEEEFLTSSVTVSAKRKRIIVESDEEMDPPPAITTDSNKPEVSDKVNISSGKKPTKTIKPPAHKEVLVTDSETDSPIAPRGRKSQGEQKTEQSGSSSSSTTQQQKQKKRKKKNPDSPVASVQSSANVEVNSKTASSCSSCSKFVDNSHSGKKHHVKRQVMKTFQDDEGFMGEFGPHMLSYN